MKCEVCINFEGKEIPIYCKYDEKIGDIIQFFCEIIDKDDYSDSMLFKYHGIIIDKKSRLQDILTTIDKFSTKICISAFISEIEDLNLIKYKKTEIKNKKNTRETANYWKIKGNELVKEKKYKYALDCYTKAIDIDPNDPILYSNRSEMYFNLNQFEEAIIDAEKSISLKPNYVKGYLRKGKALEGQGKIQEAYDTYKLGLEKDKTNAQLLEASQELEALLNNPFFKNYPKLYADPRTRTLMLDPQFRQGTDLVMKDENMFRQSFQSDPRLLTAFSVLSGIDLNQIYEDLKKQLEERKKRRRKEKEGR